MEEFKKIDAKVSLVRNKKPDGTPETDKRKAEILLLVEIPKINRSFAFTGNDCVEAEARKLKNMEDFEIINEPKDLFEWVFDMFGCKL